jgi:hypothetical protein
MLQILAAPNHEKRHNRAHPKTLTRASPFGKQKPHFSEL